MLARGRRCRAIVYGGQEDRAAGLATRSAPAPSDRQSDPTSGTFGDLADGQEGPRSDSSLSGSALPDRQSQGTTDRYVADT